MTDLRIPAHRRQFVVGPAPKAPHPTWQVVDLGAGRFLSHCPQLRVEIEHTPDRVPAILFGLAVQSLPDRPDPTTVLGATPAALLPGATRSWAGRWALLLGDQLVTDATAQLGCHWAATDPLGVWVSSSPALLAEVPGIGSPTVGPLHYERGVSWVVGPGGRRAGARRLLPSQVLDLGSGTVTARSLLDRATETDQPAEQLAGVLTEAIRRLPSDRPIHLGLSGGADSRVVLGAAVASGRDLDVFTRRAKRMTMADRILPPELCAITGQHHRLLTPRRPDGQRWLLARRHTDDHVSAGDARPFLTGVRDSLVGVELGGQGFGVGKALMRKLPGEIGDQQGTARAILLELGGEAADDSIDSMGAWLAWVTSHPEPALDWRDRFYLEQRMAGWQASKEQLYDLNHHERIGPLNSSLALTLLLATPEHDRQSGEAQREVLAALDPQLLEIPINPPGHSFGPARRMRHAATVRWRVG